jgi:hypothetical protein
MSLLIISIPFFFLPLAAYTFHSSHEIFYLFGKSFEIHIFQPIYIYFECGSHVCTVTGIKTPRLKANRFRRWMNLLSKRQPYFPLPSPQNSSFNLITSSSIVRHLKLVLSLRVLTFLLLAPIVLKQS